ncbi:hypothetical protein CDL15_Pgr003405 [Punica granatum]|uniref:Uncharacterized protein n=1 Tax=Punica granatum TaxID=22663 RepID=A0A218X2Q5_PUNGR|nr:hypothetical protein CDL15_Pgr003405 [Punica granatum]
MQTVPLSLNTIAVSENEQDKVYHFDLCVQEAEFHSEVATALCSIRSTLSPVRRLIDCSCFPLIPQTIDSPRIHSSLLVQFLNTLIRKEPERSRPGIRTCLTHMETLGYPQTEQAAGVLNRKKLCSGGTCRTGSLQFPDFWKHNSIQFRGRSSVLVGHVELEAFSSRISGSTIASNFEVSGSPEFRTLDVADPADVKTRFGLMLSTGALLDLEFQDSFGMLLAMISLPYRLLIDYCRKILKVGTQRLKDVYVLKSSAVERAEEFQTSLASEFPQLSSCTETVG